MNALEAARRIIAEALALPTDLVPADGSMETMPEWDSIGHVRIVLALEAANGRPLPADAMVRAIDVASVADLLD
jgi:acyl carrier protein